MDSSACDFGFAFNNPQFSDRILTIEIIPDKVDDIQSSAIHAHSAAPNRKPTRCGCVIITQPNDLGTRMHREEPSVKCTILDIEDSTASAKQGEDGDKVTEESSSSGLLGLNKNGDHEATGRNDTAGSRDSLSILSVKSIHVSSAILAGHSPYFYKLFSNGMNEPCQRVARLRIHASEESAVIELLNFMYNNTLSTTTPSGLLDILIIADKFEVASCIQYCIQRLRSLPMTVESALSYLNLPSRVLHAEGLQLLTDSAKQFIAFQFRNSDKLDDQILNMPLAAIEAVLSSDDIQVESEDVVYDIVLKWAEFNYPSLQERKEILDTRLQKLIRFPHMSSQKLKKVMACTDFSLQVVSIRVLQALFFKTEPQYIQRKYASGKNPPEVNTYNRYVERAYRCRPVKDIEIELPRPHTVAYLELKREECVRMLPAGSIHSQTFYLDRQGFYLLAHCSIDQQNMPHCFGLYLGLQDKGSASIAVDLEFAAFLKEENDYKEMYKGSHTFTGDQRCAGLGNFFKVPWASFIADDSPYFFNDILHLRAQVAFMQ